MNMSYCRFQNTLIDFRECVKAVEEDAELSDEETSAMLDLVTLAAKLVRIMTPKYYTTHSPDGSTQVIDPESRTISEYPPPRTTYKVVDQESAIRIKPANGGALYLYVRNADRAQMKIIGAIRQLLQESGSLRGQLHDEIDANTAFREAGGALPDEDMPTFCARLIRERNELNAVVADIRNGTLVANQARA